MGNRNWNFHRRKNKFSRAIANEIGLINPATPYFLPVNSVMQFLFETIAFYDHKPVYYRLYQTGVGRYFAENTNEPGDAEFYFTLVDGEWISDDERYQVQATEIGEELNN